MKKKKESDADIIQFEYFYYTDRLGAVDSGRNVTPEVIKISSVSERKKFLISEKVTYGCWNKLYRHDLLKRLIPPTQNMSFMRSRFLYTLFYILQIKS